MCGLAGVFTYGGERTDVIRELQLSMVQNLRHRGPDSYGLYQDSHAGLAHARLSIIDLAGGDQPMANEDRTLWISYNGEIYNYIELRRELQQRNHRFRTSCDTEVIIHAYEEWGTDCFTRFNGQWAVALWDAKRRQLCLCRDRVGVRPLYVLSQSHRLLFASEIKAIFADRSLHRAINSHGLAQTFTYWCPVAPVTLFDGVEEVRPGSYRIYDSRGLKDERVYWTPPFVPQASSPPPRTMEEAAAGLQERLIDAVKLRMTRADVPVGCYLSGGIDSSVTTNFAREYASGDFKTFSVRFADSEFDEGPYQRMMVERIGSKHEDIVVTRGTIADVFPDVVFHAEQPVLRTAPAPLFLLSQLVRDGGCKTVLTGEGADEFLAGYDIFREAKIRQFWSRQPGSTVRPRLFDRLYPYLARSPQQARLMAMEYWKVNLDRAGKPGFSHERRWTTTSSLHRFFSRELKSTIATAPLDVLPLSLPPDFQEWDELHQAQFLEIGTLFSDYILSAQGDRMLMSHGIEGRFPFLDYRVMEYCCALDPLHTLPGLREKAVLKHLAKDVIPEPILRRPKQPYRAPDAVCFVGTSSPAWVADALSEQSIVEAGLFAFQAVTGLVRKLKDAQAHSAGQATPSNTDNMALIGILSTQLLHEQFVKGHTPPIFEGSLPWKLTVDIVAETNMGNS
jgi:asparagine synthase (glutamine-hydrolysing)